MVIPREAFYLFLTVAGIILVASILWLLYGIMKVSKSVKVINESNLEKAPDTELVNLAEMIKRNRKNINIEDFKALPYTDLESIDLKATNLWCELGRLIYTNEKSFVIWLYEENKDLSEEQPIALLDNEIGYNKVRNLLGKIALGIPV